MSNSDADLPDQDAGSEAGSQFSDSSSQSAKQKARLRLVEASARLKAIREENEADRKHKKELLELERLMEERKSEFEREKKLRDALAEFSLADQIVQVMEEKPVPSPTGAPAIPVFEEEVLASSIIDEEVFTNLVPLKEVASVKVSPPEKIDVPPNVFHLKDSKKVLSGQFLTEQGASSKFLPHAKIEHDTHIGPPAARSQNNDVLSSIASLADALKRGPSLPTIEMAKFSGDPSDFADFKTRFTINIESHVNGDSERFLRLLSLCEGKAREAIKGCVNLPVGRMYETAWASLTEYFGQPHMVAGCQIRRLKDLQLKSFDASALMGFACRLEEAKRVLDSLGPDYASRLDSDDIIKTLMRKLDEHLRKKWVERAGYLLESQSSVGFSDFANFVKGQGRRMNNTFGEELKTTKCTRLTAMATTSQPCATTRSSECLLCKGTHALWHCDSFKSLMPDERYRFIRKASLCLRCMCPGHMARNCRKPFRCSVCKSERHNSLLHKDISIPDVTVASTKVNSTAAVWLKVVPVRVTANHRSVITYAFLDSGSDSTLCTSALLNTLGVQGREISYRLSTISDQRDMNGRRATLGVSSLDGNASYDLTCLSTETIPVTHDNFARPSDLKKFPHLKGIELPMCENASISLLIGSDYAGIVESQYEKRSGGANEPLAVKTCFGWTVCGPSGAKSSLVSVNRVQIEDQLEVQFQKLYDTEFQDLVSADNKLASPEDHRASAIMERTAQLKCGHYYINLPFRDDPADLKGNFPQAKMRLGHLKRKLSRDPLLKSKYREVIQRYEDEGAARRVGRVEEEDRWYLPHHAVCSATKTAPRVVFDCAAKFEGRSLNDFLYKGPENTSALVEVLLRFRINPIAVTADIKSMFHQVRVSDEDTKKLSFLWWTTDDFELDPETYEMLVHVFGATSSPSVCGFALRKTADDNRDSFSPEALETVERDFYVDDLLKSFPNSSVAVAVTKEISELTSRGGFQLTKWRSNCPEVLSSIPTEEQAPSIEKCGLDPCNVTKTLGIVWKIEGDLLMTDVTLGTFPKTRRGVLSSVATIFDPLGMASPLIFPGKMINQDLCRLKMDWDADLPDEIRTAWEEWLDQLQQADSFMIPRCLKPTFEIVKVELHHFSDASDSGYGTVSYLRFISASGSVYCSFVYGRSRVRPLKQGITIPKMELTAATVLVSVNNLVLRSFEGRLTIDQIFFWTDSMIVLKYVHNETKNLTVFVANRVAKIREISSPSQWNYVRSADNPADVASRGIQVSDNLKWRLWTQGPAFLWNLSECDDSSMRDFNLQDEDEGVKQSKIVLLTNTSDEFWPSLLKRFSTWTKLTRVFAWILRAVARFKGDDVGVGGLSVLELEKSERSIVKAAQEEAYQDFASRKVKDLAKLKPVVRNGLLCVGGRLTHSNLPEDTKHPIILPHKHPVTELLIEHVHRTHGHVGTIHTLSLLREKFWVVHGVSSVRNALRKCHVCRRHNAAPGAQIMASLPVVRVTADEGTFAFEVTGVDLFGPLLVTRAVRTRSQGIGTYMKRYGVIFTCMKCRAVHLEIALDLSTDSFINTLLRFIARRGAPRILYSDNGTNFKGAAAEVIDGLRRLDQERIGRRLGERKIEWRFNPPGASHRGGVWERLIRSVRKILNSQLQQRILNEDTLHTYFCEVERILNDRPLTKISDDPQDLRCLTPNHILLVSRNPSTSMFEDDGSSSRIRWKAVMTAAQEFWDRWRKEYLTTLQETQKWFLKKRNLQVGDLVLLVDGCTPRGSWKKAVVSDVLLSDDGCVREVIVRCAEGSLRRDVRKICILEEALISSPV